MAENSVSSQIFLIMLSLITPLVQKAKFNFCIQAMSKQYSDVCCLFLFRGGAGGACAEAKIWLHKALRPIQFLAPFISFYFEILSYLACVVKKTRLAS